MTTNRPMVLQRARSNHPQGDKKLTIGAEYQQDPLNNSPVVGVVHRNPEYVPNLRGAE